MNARTLRSITDIFEAEMERAGYGALARAFAEKFDVQVTIFHEILDLLSSAMKEKLEVKFSKADLDYFAAQQSATVDSLEAVVGRVAAVAQTKSLFGIGGLKMADLAETLAQGLQKTLPEAVRIAETAVSVFYRTVADRGFQKVEAGLPGAAIQYGYFGPNDKLTRPFCRHLLMSDRIFTRAQIEAMDNGQLPNPFLTGGGYNCRHSWLLKMERAEEKAA
jgi:hypothetical protein